MIMTNSTQSSLTCLTLLLISLLRINAQNITDTRLLSNPAVSDNNIAFIYAEDLWVANRDGTNPRRLTIDEGVESNPVFSPDGSTIAFSAEYDGNVDVFMVPAAGGIPKRLTWHPTWDAAQGFTPDGKAVLFVSNRATYTNRHAKLYTVETSGGQPVALPIPTTFQKSFSNDGRYMVIPSGEIDIRSHPPS